MGEAKGWEYMKRFNANVAQYTRSGIGPTQLVGRGEVGVGILFAHDILGSIEKGFPIEMSLAQEGTGYDLFCVVMLKDAPEAGRRQEVRRLVAARRNRSSCSPRPNSTTCRPIPRPRCTTS